MRGAAAAFILLLMLLFAAVIKNQQHLASPGTCMLPRWLLVRQLVTGCVLRIWYKNLCTFSSAVIFGMNEQMRSNIDT
jgi:uncharacterized membrane protein